MTHATSEFENKKPSYMPWNEDAFWGDSGVQVMTALQRWMYRTLLQNSFFCATRPYLPNNDNQLWKLAGCADKQQWIENKGPVKGMFTQIKLDGHRFLCRKRVLEDWQRLVNKRKEMHDKASRAGMASALSRKQHMLNRSSTQVNGESTKKELEVEREVEVKQEVEVKGQLELEGEAEEKLSLEQDGQDCDDPRERDTHTILHTAAGTRTTPEVNVKSGGLKEGTSLGFLSPEARKVMEEIAYISERRVVPDYKQSQVIASWLQTYPADEIVEAFTCFYVQLEDKDDDDFEIRHATRTFCETGPVRIESRRRQVKEWTQKREELARERQELANAQAGERGIIESAPLRD